MTKSDPGLIRAAIDLSGLSARRFARDVLIRNERTIRRWLAGDSPIPAEARDWLTRYVARRRRKKVTNS